MDAAPDTTPDQSPDDRWLSFAELAENRGISLASAVRLVRRKKWRRQKDNEGRIRCLVPVSWLRADEPKEDAPGVLSAVTSAFQTALQAKDDTIASLKGEIATKDELVAELRADVQRAQEALRQAEAREAARLARGLPRRILDAWRGR